MPEFLTIKINQMVHRFPVISSVRVRNLIRTRCFDHGLLPFPDRLIAQSAIQTEGLPFNGILRFRVSAAIHKCLTGIVLIF